VRNPLLFGAVVLGTGLYYMSRATHAEVQSTKTQPQHENRELTASAARKDVLKEGKAEKTAHQAGGSSQDGKPERAVAEKKPSSGADEEAKTGKIRGGHDESGQPKDEKLRAKGAAKAGKDDEKKSEKQEEQDGKHGSQDDDGEEEGQEGQQAFSIYPQLLVVLTN